MNEDFSKGKRGAVVPSNPNKTRITIRLDANIINHFKKLVDDAGGGNYQTLINDKRGNDVRVIWSAGLCFRGL